MQRGQEYNNSQIVKIICEHYDFFLAQFNHTVKLYDHNEEYKSFSRAFEELFTQLASEAVKKSKAKEKQERQSPESLLISETDKRSRIKFDCDTISYDGASPRTEYKRKFKEEYQQALYDIGNKNTTKPLINFLNEHKALSELFSENLTKLIELAIIWREQKLLDKEQELKKQHRSKMLVEQKKLELKLKENEDRLNLEYKEEEKEAINFIVALEKKILKHLSDHYTNGTAYFLHQEVVKDFESGIGCKKDTAGNRKFTDVEFILSQKNCILGLMGKSLEKCIKQLGISYEDIPKTPKLKAFAFFKRKSKPLHKSLIENSIKDSKHREAIQKDKQLLSILKYIYNNCINIEVNKNNNNNNNTNNLNDESGRFFLALMNTVSIEDSTKKLEHISSLCTDFIDQVKKVGLNKIFTGKTTYDRMAQLQYFEHKISFLLANLEKKIADSKKEIKVSSKNDNRN